VRGVELAPHGAAAALMVIENPCSGECALPSSAALGSDNAELIAGFIIM
jgi:hypothetical protein